MSGCEKVWPAPDISADDESVCELGAHPLSTLSVHVLRGRFGKTARRLPPLLNACGARPLVRLHVKFTL